MSQRGSGPWARAVRIRILVLLCLLRPAPVASPTITEWDRAASLTPKCLRGFYLPENSRTCSPCPEGSFTSHNNSLSSCQPCSICPADKEKTASCTSTRDTQCQCKNGTYQDKDSPEFCLPCSSGCPEGKVKAKACGPLNDLECVDQQSGIPWWGVLLICAGFAVFGVALLVIYCYRTCYLPDSRAAAKIGIRDWFCCPQTSGETEALDNAYNLARDSRNSLSSEQEQEEPPGVPEQPAGEAQHLLGPAGPRGSQMRRKLLAPANKERPMETLRECFYDFSKHVPFHCWDRLMRELGLTDNDISFAKAQGVDLQDGFYKMMTTWLNTQGKAASVNTILESLEKIGERHAKEIIEEHLVRSGKYVYEEDEAGSAVSSEKDLM